MMAWGLLVIRLVVGLTFAGHGLQKLFGWFGGYGVKGTAGWLESIGMKPGIVMAVLAGLSELAGGLLFAGGLLLPVAAALITMTMLIAIVKVHGKNGYWIAAGGIEYNILLIAIVVGIALIGGGEYSFS